jgi:trk system potassium uptake protein
MYIIIAGCRKVGANLAWSLSRDNHDVVVIDSDPHNLEVLGSGFNGVTLLGMPIDEDVLRSAGIEQADALAAVTNEDNMNVMVSQIARELYRVPIVITRVYDPEREIILDKLGMMTVCPTTLAVDRIREMLMPGNRAGTLSIGGTSLSFRYEKPARRCLGRTVAEARDVPVLGYMKNGCFSLAAADTVIDADMTLVVPEYTLRERDQQ